MSVNTNIKNTNVKTFTFEVQPHNVKLLDHLMDHYVFPILRKNTEVNLAQGALRGKANRQTPEAVLNFGRSEPIKVQAQRQPTKSVAQGGLNSKELQDLDRILGFGSPSKHRRA